MCRLSFGKCSLGTCSNNAIWILVKNGKKFIGILYSEIIKFLIQHSFLNSFWALKSTHQKFRIRVGVSGLNLGSSLSSSSIYGLIIKVHPSLDLKNEPVRPLLFTKLCNSLNPIKIIVK